MSKSFSINNRKMAFLQFFSAFFLELSKKYVQIFVKHSKFNEYFKVFYQGKY